MALRRASRVFVAISGWLVALILAGPVVSHLHKRYRVRFPSVQREVWARAVQDRKSVLGGEKWQDGRRLHIFCGDSHIELGSWYDLFYGGVSVRNCGLSGAQISDVAEVVAAIADQNVDTVVLMCGINNIGRGAAVSECLGEYKKLLEVVHARLHPRRVIVLSVMPVLQTPVDERSRRNNEAVRLINEELRALCASQQVGFLDVSPSIVRADRSLAPEFTLDGLHLNDAGYRALAAALRKELQNP